MIKSDLVKDVITEGMEFKSKKAQKEYADVKIQEINDLVYKIAEVLEVGESAKLGKVVISKIEVPAKNGEITLKDGSKKPWHKDAEIVVKVKLVK